MPEAALALVPTGVTFEQAAAVPMAAVTALQALRVLRPGGRYVFVGGSGGATLAAALRGKGMLTRPNREDLEVVADLIANGSVRPFVGATFPMPRGAEALRLFEDGKTHGKVVLAVEQPATPAPGRAAPGREMPDREALDRKTPDR